MPVSTSAVKVNPVTGALIDPPVATFAAANGLLTGGSSDAKDSVRAATTTNGTLATAFENGDTIDGIVLATSDRILIKNQSAPAENGIYVVAASGAPTRATDFDAWTEIVGAFVTVESGTVNAGTQWLCNVVAGGTLGTTAITFVVPKNYVDLTTTQTVTGAKTFNNITGSVINSTTIGVTTPAAGWFTLVNGLYISVGSDASLGISQELGVSFDAPATESIIIRSAASSDVTLPASGTLLSTAAIGVSVQAYDADLTTWAGITPGANVGTFLATPSSANLAAAVTDETGSGALVFGTSPTITTPVITNINPGANFTLTNNSVSVITSKNTGAVVNTLVLDNGAVGIGLISPTYTGGNKLHVYESTAASIRATVEAGNTGYNSAIRLISAKDWFIQSNGSLASNPGRLSFIQNTDSVTPLELSSSQGVILTKTITAAATTGAQTINKTSGSVNFAAAATSLVVTNSFVSTSSVIIATVGTNDTTMKSVACVAAAGSFTMHAAAAPTAETRVNFLVTN
jgi:hypothetical protein